MNKSEVAQRVLLGGKPLSARKFTWDKKNKVFATTASGLVLDFAGIDGVTFTTGVACTFTTGVGCTFKTSGACTFTTGGGCTFTTGVGCTFKTSGACTFKTGGGCTFKTSGACTFKTGVGCTFKTGGGCTFTTGGGCTFTTDWNCTWIVDGEKYHYPPMRIQGSHWAAGFIKPGEIRIGCEYHTCTEWTDKFDAICDEHEVVPAIRSEYRAILAAMRAWGEGNGWWNQKGGK